MRTLLVLMIVMMSAPVAARVKKRSGKTMKFDTTEQRWTSPRVDVSREHYDEKALIKCVAGARDEEREMTVTIRDDQGDTIDECVADNCRGGPRGGSTCYGDAVCAMGYSPEIPDGKVTIEITWSPSESRLTGRCVLEYMKEVPG